MGRPHFHKYCCFWLGKMHSEKICNVLNVFSEDNLHFQWSHWKAASGLPVFSVVKCCSWLQPLGNPWRCLFGLWSRMSPFTEKYKVEIVSLKGVKFYSSFIKCVRLIWRKCFKWLTLIRRTVKSANNNNPFLVTKCLSRLEVIPFILNYVLIYWSLIYLEQYQS